MASTTNLIMKYAELLTERNKNYNHFQAENAHDYIGRAVKLSTVKRSLRKLVAEEKLVRIPCPYCKNKHYVYYTAFSKGE